MYAINFNKCDGFNYNKLDYCNAILIIATSFYASEVRVAATVCAVLKNWAEVASKVLIGVAPPSRTRTIRFLLVVKTAVNDSVVARANTSM